MFHSPPHLHDSDAMLLEALTAPTFPKAKLSRRDADLDPLMLAAALASGPHVTRNHYHHDFFPAVMMPKAEGAYDWTKWQGEDANSHKERPNLTYVSQQAPRSVRLKQALAAQKENDPGDVTDVLKSSENLPPFPRKRQSSKTSTHRLNGLTVPLSGPMRVKCMARTRIPTSHGPVFLHLYHNNKDDKEHLAIVVDPSQLSEDAPPLAPPIRSRSLDAVWHENETEMDRITRGAYVGRLTPSSHRASSPSSTSSPSHPRLPPPLVRLHSECFTGETVGSMRCDCGEQLDTAIRVISQSTTIPASEHTPTPITFPGRGAIIYLRQEGRGIGLLSKIRAYNLQDLGHDTVTANLMLGHQADERGYEVAAAILQDLGMGDNVRLLTNNPDKVRALEMEGVKVTERLPMIPRSWQAKKRAFNKSVSSHEEIVVVEQGDNRIPFGDDLDKYLRTKVLRMGHMLPMLWSEEMSSS